MPTGTANPVHALIASDAWGTRQILTICRTLPREQFHKRFDIGWAHCTTRSRTPSGPCASGRIGWRAVRCGRA